jgi:hypothetical protein
MRITVAHGGGVFGAVGEKGKRKEQAMDDAMFLYPPKAAAGPCRRLA